MDAETAKDAGRMAHEGGTPRDGVAKWSRRQASVALAVCGEPVVGRALALLLRGPRYDTRFVSASSAGEVASLESVRLLLLTPTPGLGAERREALLATLTQATAVAGIPILELVACPERADRRHAQVRWPCSAEQLERCIEAALLAGLRDDDRRDGSQACSTEGRWSA
jgi:hypothetical protein